MERRDQIGRTKAEDVQPVEAVRPVEEDGSPGVATVAAFCTAGGFLILLGVLALGRAPPLWVPGLYLGASLLTYLVYAGDKAAARRGRWRTPENTLHFRLFRTGLGCDAPSSAAA